MGISNDSQLKMVCEEIATLEWINRAFKCDKCGQLYDFNALPKKHYKIVTNPNTRSNELDLCPNCYDTLEKWMNGDVQMIVFNDSKANITTDAGNAQLLAEKIIKQAETEHYRKVAP